MTRSATRISRRTFLLAALTAAGASVSLGACATGTFPFIPDHYTFSRQQVQDAVQRKFPYQRSVSQLFDVSLTNPVVELLPERNRVSVRLDVRLTSPLIRQPVNGAFMLSSELAYDSASRSVVLRSPSVDRVDVDGDAAPYAQQINAVAALVATQLLNNYPVYTFKPDQLQFAGVNYEPGTITILTNGIRAQIVEK
ncbi:DUF1439 domain-containing protein [Paraburkholderia caballeronis]|uniref:DUF1439 domain-containing protein n=1 Tax=Paraburkholderia caballeronis TaxID=416943 RepID=A0A1H7TKB9_9BURK|nr:DUF1439 domain-containing protein [Paraburkholderia caballeronis]PXW18423.1 uncharacterized protein DUF1439 [Paraburkholderia caballeronis]PXW95703.1 uncharacterized protein DUF1439 [Paraburkholderia caballeronis]RAJ92049.1 uncharacterized protein DUF1439 [Paraburkholderia caballeronis]SEB76648.1 Protein of unknown function [Paraburkholderia caballeronis]SEL85005.1 Protein of unknown function [Paraburkholderia caballeronis]